MPRRPKKPAALSVKPAAIAAVLLACLSVVAFLPGGFSRWTFPKLLVMVIAVAVALFGPRTGRLPHWTWWVAGGGLAVLALAAVVNGDPTGLWGRWPRYTGPLVAVPVGVGAVWLGAVLLGPDAPDRLRRLFRDGLAVAAILIAGVALLETFGLRPIASDLARPGSLLGNASDQAVVGLMIAAVLFAYLLGVTPLRGSWLAVVGLVAALGAVTLSASRAGYGGVLVALVIVAVLAALARRRDGLTPPVPRRIWLWLGVMVLAAAIFVAANPESLRRLFVRSGLAQRRGDRWAIWNAAADVIAQSPVFGTGAGGFIDAAPGVLSAQWFTINGSSTTLESPHNWLLEVTTDGGVTLLAVVIAGVALAGREVWRRFRRNDAPDAAWLTHGSIAALVGALAALLFYFVNAGVLLLGGLLLGSLLAVPASTPRSLNLSTRRGRGAPAAGQTGAARSPLPRWAVIGQRVVAIVWAAMLLVVTLAEYPLAQGVQRAANGDPATAESFSAAQSQRPWDGDIASIAAQSLAQAAQSGDPGLVAAAVEWGGRAAQRLPRSVAALEAWAVALEAAHDLPPAVEARARVVGAAPNDAVARLNYAITLAMAGRYEEAVEQATHAHDLDPTLKHAEELAVRLCMDLPIPGCRR